MNNQKNKGFTLVELIVVITILAILGTITFLSFGGFSNIAASYKSLGYKSTGGFDYNSSAPSNIVVYSSGSLASLNTDQLQLRNLTRNLQTAYTNTQIAGNDSYAKILSVNADIDSEITASVGNIVNKYLGGSIDTTTATQGPIESTGYGQSETAGWISIGTNIDGTTVTGYLHSEILGWICLQTSCNSNVSRDVLSGNLTGYGLSETFGWINMSGTNIDDGGVLSGYGQSEILGRISF